MYKKMFVLSLTTIFSLFLINLFFLGQPIASDSLVPKLNQIRASYNLAPLVENSKLYLSSNNKACDMSEKKYWSHTDPNNNRFDWWILQAGYNYYAAGENLARYFNNDSNMIASWMKSPPHKKNILSKDYKEIGIGRCGDYVVLHFGKR